MAQISSMRSASLYFPLGQIVLDNRAAKRLSSEDVIPALSRHMSGDWGGVSKARRTANQLALRKNRPLCSVYFSMDGVRFRVMTNARRSLTSIKAF
jgi:hypothetical protein